MSKEVMAECLEEAIDIWAATMSPLHQEFQLADSAYLVTIAVALYQERMRHQTPSPTYGYPVLQVTPAVDKGGTYDVGTGRRVG